MRKAKTLFRLWNLDASCYITDMGCTCFAKPRAVNMQKDLEARGYSIRLDAWSPR